MTYDELQQQLAWRPQVTGRLGLPRQRVIVGGMGGSALPAHALRFLDSAFPVEAHHDYDLPERSDHTALYVAISYSGNTEETLSFAQRAGALGYALAIVTDAGGDLEQFAQEKGVPHVIVPGGIQPRDALFYLLHALLLLLGREDLSEQLRAVSFDAEIAERNAQTLSRALANAFPIFYASRRNGFLAHTAKIQMNESGKMPAAANVFPELNHNEMQSYDVAAPEAVGQLARFVLFVDQSDDPRIARRMALFAKLMGERSRAVVQLPLAQGMRAEQLVSAWYVTHQAARSLASARHIDPDQVPLIESFKAQL